MHTQDTAGQSPQVQVLVAGKLYAPEEIAGPVAVLLEGTTIRDIWRGTDVASAWKVRLFAGQRRVLNTSKASVHLIPLRWRSWRPWDVAGCASLITHRKKMRMLVSWLRLSGSVFWHALVTRQPPMNRLFEPL